jgi:hypothetical protein
MALAPHIEVSQELLRHGFRPLTFRRNTLRMRGVLRCAFGELPVDLTIDDWDFIQYPYIRLRERPARLKGVQPHIFARGGLCYYAPGVVVLDRHDPVGAVLQCLAQAEAVVNDLALDPGYRREEFTREFLAEWTLGQDPTPLGVVKAGVASDAIEVSTVIFEGVAVAVGSDLTELKAIAGSLNTPMLEMETTRAWVMRTQRWPVLTDSFPRHVQAALAWLKAWDPGLCDHLFRRMKADRNYLDWPVLRLLVSGPFGWLMLDLSLGTAADRLRGKHDRRSYIQRFRGPKAKHFNVTRYRVDDWSSDFIHSRNLTFPDLRGRTITLVGCGAIGSHLAEALVRLGAGHGRGGRLRLIDTQRLRAENLGRHALGFPALEQPKAKAMADELRRSFPLAEVVHQTDSALNYKDLFADELLIDATGEEALSEAINARHQQMPVGTAPVLYARIFGNGEAVQTLWVDGPGQGACYRCLRGNDAQNPRAERFPLSNGPRQLQVWRGCNAVTPYAVSAPMHAAALATDAICDWLQAKASPHFRTLARPGADVMKIKSQDVSRLPNCPVCSRRSTVNRVA